MKAAAAKGTELEHRRADAALWQPAADSKY
jgi:hypothetical protein